MKQEFDAIFNTLSVVLSDTKTDTAFRAEVFKSLLIYLAVRYGIKKSVFLKMVDSARELELLTPPDLVALGGMLMAYDEDPKCELQDAGIETESPDDYGFMRN